MNPDNYQYPVDYLNAISSPAKPKSSNKLFFIGGAAAILVAIIVFFMLANLSNTSTGKLSSLPLRLDTLSAIVTKYSADAKSSKLRAINSDLSSYLSASQTALTDPLKSVGIDKNKPSKSAKASETSYSKTITDKLDDAKLNAIFDRTYGTEISYQLEKLQLLLVASAKNTKSKSLTDALTTTSTNISAVQKELDDFNQRTTTD